MTLKDKLYSYDRLFDRHGTHFVYSYMVRSNLKITSRQIQRDFPAFLRLLFSNGTLVLTYKGKNLAKITLLKDAKKDLIEDAKRALKALLKSKPSIPRKERDLIAKGKYKEIYYSDLDKRIQN